MKFSSFFLLSFCLGFLPSNKGNPLSTTEVQNENPEQVAGRNFADYDAKLIVKNIEENFDESSKDNSAFDKLLAVNEKLGHRRVKLVQGDIVEGKSVIKMMKNGKRGAASNNKDHIWPINNGKHEIPYVISGALSWAHNSIVGAMKEWTDKVPCLNFVPRTNGHRGGYLYFDSRSGCYSNVGYQPNGQVVSLGPGCVQHGVIVHEIGHALGFWHEQSRSDRDRYLTIFWENVIPDQKHNFEIKYGQTDDRSHGYDYASIMQYGPKAFSKNGRDTIRAKNGASIGQTRGLSEGDVQQAKTMYTLCRGGSAGCAPDKNRHCKDWAAKGYCKHGRYVTFMKKNCEKSCCPDKVITKGCLSDDNGSCQGWAARGYCRNSHMRYMLQNCKKSCYCSGNATDRNQRCREWANRGECNKNPNYMLRNCLASCCKC